MSSYWAGRLSKNELSARQLSARGGSLACAQSGPRVTIAGRATTYIRGELTL